MTTRHSLTEEQMYMCGWWEVVICTGHKADSHFSRTNKRTNACTHRPTHTHRQLTHIVTFPATSTAGPIQCHVQHTSMDLSTDLGFRRKEKAGADNGAGAIIDFRIRSLPFLFSLRLAASACTALPLSALSRGLTSSGCSSQSHHHVQHGRV